MVNIGGFVVDASSLASDGDQILAPSGQIFKLLCYLNDRSNSDTTLTLAEGTTQSFVFAAKSGSVDGASGLRLSVPGHDSHTGTWVMTPVYIDDTISIKLSGNRNAASDMICISYMRVE
jgi:hypothetical protein|tara:strand:+ start:30 stop:386 length:357 start_codon:yes stop_codon:yes gene_type:complete